jgi:hypothetical protein
VTANGDVLTTTDWDDKVELYGPAHPESPLMARIISFIQRVPLS